MAKRFWAFVAAVLIVGLPAEAVTAVLEVKEDGMYTKMKQNVYKGASLTNYYAPLPVFFEGWRSYPKTDIVEYRWDFGDGSPLYYGFNAAHVYEKPGQYTATLTVTDKAGRKSTDQIRITVRQPNGKVYYVDSAKGSDSNPGTSPSAAWRTATHAFRGMTNNRYKPGDRILFKRGQVFEFEAGKVAPGHYATGYGYSFGAYGEGPKPIIQKVGPGTTTMIRMSSVGLAHWALCDLEFRLTSPEGIPAGDLFTCSMQAHNLLFLRVDVRDMNFGIGLSGGFKDRRISGVFLQDCNFYNSNNVMLFARCVRLAVLNSNFDLSNNHLAYISYLDRGVIDGNTFTRPPFGRTAIRLCAATESTHPTNNICITNNFFKGWIDPQKEGSAHNGKGFRYTWELVDLSPNTTSNYGIKQIYFANNKLVDAETLLVMGNCEDVTVENNYFYTNDTYQTPYRIQLGAHFETRPLVDIRIRNNTIVSNEARRYHAGIIGILFYKGAPYRGFTNHSKIQIHNNTVDLRDCNGAPFIYIQDPYHGQPQQIKSDYNTLYTPGFAPGYFNLFQIGGDYHNYNLIDMATWRARTGNDRHSMIAGPVSQLLEPVLGQKDGSSKNSDSEEPTYAFCPLWDEAAEEGT